MLAHPTQEGWQLVSTCSERKVREKQEMYVVLLTEGDLADSGHKLGEYDSNPKSHLLGRKEDFK